MTLQFNAVLQPPGPGQILLIAGCTVTVKTCSCCKGAKPVFYVHSGDEIVAMGRSWQGLCHYRRWQFDPVIKHSRPQSWPDEELNAWQLLGWAIARRDLAAEKTADPIPWTHPECGLPPPLPVDGTEYWLAEGAQDAREAFGTPPKISTRPAPPPAPPAAVLEPVEPPPQNEQRSLFE